MACKFSWRGQTPEVTLSNGNRSKLFDSFYSLGYEGSSEDALAYYAEAAKYSGNDKYYLDDNQEPVLMFMSRSPGNDFGLPDKLVFTTSFQEAIRHDSKRLGIEVGIVRKGKSIDMGRLSEDDMVVRVRGMGPLTQDQIQFQDEQGNTFLVSSSYNDFLSLSRYNHNVKTNLPTFTQFLSGLVETGVVSPLKRLVEGIGTRQRSFTLDKPLYLFKGLKGKTNPDGTVRTAHPDVTFPFFAGNRETARRYSDEDVDLVEVSIPEGTTVERINLQEGQSLSQLRQDETQAIMASKAQVVQLETVDAQGQETQFIVKDLNLIGTQALIMVPTPQRMEPLEGTPKVEGATGPDPNLVIVAEEYALSRDIDLKRQKEYVKVDETRAKRIAEAYENMEHTPNDERVKEAYDSLIEQTLAQYEALQKAGYRFYFYGAENDPYEGKPWRAMKDLRANKTMAVFSTESGYGEGANAGDGSNPMLQEAGMEWPYGSLSGQPRKVLINDLFRAVHDTFGHGLEGAGFRARGEENAWQAHVRLYTGPAVAAITTETRGQNSWVNFGPYGEQNKKASAEETVFAEQKIGLLPEFAWQEGRAGDMQEESAQNQKVSKVKLGATTITYADRTNPITEQTTGELEVVLVETDPDARGTGSARRAMEAFIGFADTVGAELFLTVSPRDESTSFEKLAGFYKSLGFKETEVDFEMRREPSIETDFESPARSVDFVINQMIRDGKIDASCKL